MSRAEEIERAAITPAKRDEWERAAAKDKTLPLWAAWAVPALLSSEAEATARAERAEGENKRLKRVAEMAEVLSSAMVEAEAYNADFDRVQEPWQLLTAAIQAWRAALKEPS
jgi:hypothetical protein